jgi:hypothetical protein
VLIGSVFGKAAAHVVVNRWQMILTRMKPTSLASDGSQFESDEIGIDCADAVKHDHMRQTPKLLLLTSALQESESRVCTFSASAIKSGQ